MNKKETRGNCWCESVANTFFAVSLTLVKSELFL